MSTSASMSALLRMASSAISDVNFLSSMSAAFLTASSAFDCFFPSKALAEFNSFIRCLQLMLDAIFSCCDGLMAADVNSSLPCLPARHCCTDGHCVSPLDLLDVPSARRRVWDEVMPLEILGSERGRRCHQVVVMMMHRRLASRAQR